MENPFVRKADNRTPGERINQLKAADMDPRTAVPAVIVVSDQDVAEGIGELAERIGSTVAERRYLVALVDRLLYAAETSVRYAEATASGGDVQTTPQQEDHARGFLAGVNHVADALAEVMNERPGPPANDATATARPVGSAEGGRVTGGPGGGRRGTGEREA